MTLSEPTLVYVTGAVLSTTAGELPLTAHFLYTATDPMAVGMTLIVEQELDNGTVFSDETTWVFGRDLLDGAMSSMLPTGDGDVTVNYIADRDVVRIDLTDIDGNKVPLFVDAAPLVGFLEESFAMVPAYAEAVEVSDAEIAALLEESA